MSPTLTDPSKPTPLRSRRPVRPTDLDNPLNQLRVPIRSAVKPGELKVRDIVGPLIIDPSSSPTEHSKSIDIIPQSQTVAKKTQKSLWQQVKDGACLAFKVVVPTWLLLWLGGFVANKAIITLGLKVSAPISRSLDAAALQRAQINSTPDLSASLARAQGIRSALQNGSIDTSAATKALGSSDLSYQTIWQKLSATRRLLNDYSPQLSKWFEQKAARGEVLFVSDNFEFGAERYSDYRSWNKQLTIYRGFFELNDGQKVSIIRHERSHADETWPEYISNSLQPSVFVGASMRAGSVLLANTSVLLAAQMNSSFPTAAQSLNNTAQKLWQVDDPETLASRLRYSGNRSEHQAMQAELNAASSLGVEMAADQITIDSISAPNQDTTPWQELIALSSLGALGLSKLLRRRSRPRLSLSLERRDLKLASFN